MVVLAQGLNSPDDLALAPNGTLYFSDTGKGTIEQLNPNGTASVVVSGLVEPEGIVILPDGNLIVVEQGKNRLLLVHPGQPPAVWLALENKTGQAGVDNLIRDPKSGDLIIPDSPNGRILRVTMEKQVKVIATGFVRPTGVDVEGDGSLIVADEFGNTVKRVHADGRSESLGRFAEPDDVLVDRDGNIFVASLADNSIRRITRVGISAAAGASALIATIYNPQGMVLDAEGNLIVAEPGLNRLVRLIIR